MLDRNRRPSSTNPANAGPSKTSMDGSGVAWVNVNEPLLSKYSPGPSATMKVIVGSTSEKLANPSDASVLEESVRLVGGLLLPKPSAESAAKSRTVPSPSISNSSAPQFQAAVVPLKVRTKVDVPPPPAPLPAPLTTPPPLVQYSAGSSCRHGEPLSVKASVSF